MEENSGEFLNELSLKKAADVLEARDYQINIAKSILRKGNSLVIMPTALGKTFVIVLVMAKLVKEMLEGTRGRKKFLFLTPTKPLASQQAKRIAELVDFAEGGNKVVIENGKNHEKAGVEGAEKTEGPSATATANEIKKLKKAEEISQVMLLTGEMPPEKREILWKNPEVWCYAATPQTVEFDILAGRMDLEGFCLVVFDEAHRAVKEYSYSFVAKEAAKTDAVLVGLTASPSSKREVIDEICRNLQVENIEIRDEADHDVRKYAHSIRLDWEFVDLPAGLLNIRDSLRELLQECLKSLKEIGLIDSLDLRSHKRELLDVRRRALENLRQDPRNFQALSLQARAMNISHAIDLIEIEGVHSLLEFMHEMELREKQSKAVAGLLKDARWLSAQYACNELVLKGIEHPKFSNLKKILKAEIVGGKKAIVFAHYRNTVCKIVDELKGLEGMRPAEFVGKSNEGMSQKKQQEVMQQFRDGGYNILVATSVAEEGLDIPEVGLVVFFEAVPSEIRLIQRKGRTGRVRDGKVVVLITKGSKDEALFWVSRNREKKMRSVVENIRREGLVGIEEQGEIIGRSQQRLFEF